MTGGDKHLDVSLAEELLLVGYYRGERFIHHAAREELNCVLAGAVLMELVLGRRIDVVKGKVCVLDSTPLGEAEADRALDRIATEKTRKPFWWINRIRREGVYPKEGVYPLGGITDRTCVRLAQCGVLQLEAPEHRFRRVLGAALAPPGWSENSLTRRYRMIDSAIASAAHSRLNQVVVHGADPDARTVALLFLLFHRNGWRREVLSGVLTDVRTRQLKVRLEQLAGGQWASVGVRNAVQSILAATDREIHRVRD